MIIRSKRGIFKPKQPFVGVVKAKDNSETTSIKEALSCPNNEEVLCRWSMMP